MCTQGPKTHLLVSKSKYNMNKYVAQTALTMVMGSIPSANNILILLKEIVHPKMKIAPLFAHPRAILGIYYFLLSDKYIWN